MDIKYFGHAAFFIKTKTAKIVTDPFDPKMMGMKFPKTQADIVTVSHQHGDHNFLDQIEGAQVFDWPGEFEKVGVRIFGYQSYHDKNKGADRGENILFKIEAEEISVLHLGDLGVVLDQEAVDEIGDVDILMVPTGGFFTIDPQEAVEVVRRIEPALVIPMHYQNDPMNPEIKSKLAPLSEFLEKIGQQEATFVEKLSVRKENLAQEEMKVVPMRITT